MKSSVRFIIVALSLALTTSAAIAGKHSIVKANAPLAKPVDVRRVAPNIMRRVTQTPDGQRVEFYILRTTGMVRGGTKVVPDLGATIKYLGTTEEPGKVFAIRVKKLD